MKSCVYILGNRDRNLYGLRFACSNVINLQHTAGIILGNACCRSDAFRDGYSNGFCSCLSVIFNGDRNGHLASALKFAVVGVG